VTHTVKSLLQTISAYERETTKWRTRGEKIVKRYKDERSEAEFNVRRYNVLWSNTETLKPFLYSATPKPIVSQRGDDSDPVGRQAAEVLERALVFTVAEDHFGTSLRNARDDYLLPGRGTVWVRYVPEFKAAEPQISENNTDDAPETNANAGLGDTLEVVAFETAVVDYVHWKDFGHDLARTWEEVDVVWRRVAMNRDALKKRFGDEIGAKIPLDVKPEDQLGKTAEDKAERAMIYEMWIKSEKRAVWLSKSMPDLLDDLEDPLQLDHFFPTPRPAYATVTTDSLIPVPDYAEYQDQAAELDDLTGRIALLTKAIKAVGVYDASVPALKQILDDGHDNTLIPVENWAALTEKGGLSGAVELLPMKEIAQTLLSLYEAREKVKADLYEVSGMSDIIRGNTAPEETATAQEIKSNFATKRLEERQREVERFARNAIDLLGNVIAVHFAPETLMRMTGVKLLTAQLKALIQQGQQMGAQLQQAQQQAQQNPQLAGNVMALQQQVGVLAQQAQEGLKQAGLKPEDAQYALSKPTWEDVIALLRDQPRRRFAIDIETDSIVAPDDAQQQEQRTQFITGITQFLETAGGIVQADPTAAPLMGELLLFGARGFRVGRDLMDCLEDYIQQKEAQAKQPQPPKPDPAMAKVQADAQTAQQKQELDAQADQQRMALEDQQHQRELQQQANLEAMKAHFQQQTDTMQAQFEAAQQRQEAAMNAALEQFKALLTAKTQIEVAEINAGATLDAAEISAANQATEGE
jgi:hypothetical protein